MAWTPKVWVDRAVEFAGRRILTPTGNANEFDVKRSEGAVFVVGDEPDAANLNAEFQKIKDETDVINTNLNALSDLKISNLDYENAVVIGSGNIAGTFTYNATAKGVLRILIGSSNTGTVTAPITVNGVSFPAFRMNNTNNQYGNYDIPVDEGDTVVIVFASMWSSGILGTADGSYFIPYK